MLSLISLLVAQVTAQGDADLADIPGITFQTNFKTYSGYLNANDNGTWRMHYLLTESQSDPRNDPLLVWFDGGPGCSSMSELFAEMGPFHVNHDGQTLFENVYAWNKKANILAMESPIGVGFSYDAEAPNSIYANDDRTAQQNYQALEDFFNRVQPKYANRTFFIAGVSYGGVYIPMLSKLLVEGINNGSFPNKYFQGAAIGNGLLTVKNMYNSRVLWSAYHGRVSKSNWKKVKQVCRTGNETDPDKYNYQQFMWAGPNGIDHFADTTTACGRLIEPLIADDPGRVGDALYLFNFYQDCYKTPSSPKDQMKRFPKGYSKRQPNTATLINYYSTNNQLGYPCWNIEAYTKYFNRKDVQDALHIEHGWASQGNDTRFIGCRFVYGNLCLSVSLPMYYAYKNAYPDMKPFFDYVIANVAAPGFRFLVYNGDTDALVNYLANEWFIEDLAKAHGVTSGSRLPWTFAQQMGGMYQSYVFKNLKVDVLTVKGAGHYVPSDRPGPALQMFTNFMFPFATGSDYSSENYVQPTPVISDFLATTDNAAVISLFLALILGIAQL